MISKSRKYLKLLTISVIIFSMILGSLPVSAAEREVIGISAVYNDVFVENADGVFATDSRGNSYFRYTIDTSKLTVTCTYSDGSIEVMNAEDAGVTVYDVQYQPRRHWSVGDNTFVVIAFLQECDVTATVVENPVANVTVSYPTALQKDMDGHIETDNGGEKQYFYYDIDMHEFSITVDFSDGTSKTYTDINEIADDTGRLPVITTDQTYDTQWTVGANTVTLTFFGHTVYFDVTVVDNPIDSVSAVADRVLIEKADGLLCSAVDASTGETFTYYRYENYGVTVTVKYKDGTSLTLPYDCFTEATGYECEIFDTQSADNIWEAGTHTVCGTYVGHDFSFDVNVISNPYTQLLLSESEDGKLILSFTDESGAVTDSTVKYITYVDDATENGRRVLAHTSNGDMLLTVCYSTVLGNKTSVRYGELTSNTLSECKWLLAFEEADTLALLTHAYQRNHAERPVDYILSSVGDVSYISCMAANTFYYAIGNSDPSYISYVDEPSVGKVKYVTVKKTFIDLVISQICAEPFDVTESVFYDKEADAITAPYLYEPATMKMDAEIVSFEYKNGQWTYVIEYTDENTGNDYYMTVRLDEKNRVLMVNCGKNILIGDANLDGKVNLKDLFQFKRILLSLEDCDFGTPEFISVDMDNNQRLNTKDIFNLKKLLLGTT